MCVYVRARTFVYKTAGIFSQPASTQFSMEYIGERISVIYWASLAKTATRTDFSKHSRTDSSYEPNKFLLKYNKKSKSNFQNELDKVKIA